jgi:polygalacturonase
MAQLKRPDIPSRHFDIRDFGATDGGLVKNTQAIQTAIENAAKAGGGIVVIPKGKWLTGAIHLENNINLYISKDAELLFSQEFSDYLPVVFSRHEDIECYKYSAFIYADGKTNIAITGEGILNGQGKLWWSFKETKKNVEILLNEMANKNVPVKDRVFDGTDGKQLRPAFFQPMNCTNILVEGVTFLYGAFWTITPTYCENVIIRKVHIVTEGSYGHTPNGDGVNPSSCKNVLIEDCEFDTGDDCIAIKAGRDMDGLRVGKSTENIVIRNCRGLRGHGGIVIGSETSGSIRNVYAENCQFKGTDRIVRIKTARGRGGVIENMWFKNLTGENILLEAIHLNMLYTGKRLPTQLVSNTTPSIRNIHFENIKCLSGKGYMIELLGLPEMLIEDIWFDGIDAKTAKGINISDVRGIHFKNSNFSAMTVPLLTITDGQNISVDSVKFCGVAEQFLRVEGGSSNNIKIRKSNIPSTDKSVLLGTDVSKQAVIIKK